MKGIFHTIPQIFRAKTRTIPKMFRGKIYSERKNRA